MKVTTYEATVQDGRIVLLDDAVLPENTRVYVVVPAPSHAERIRIVSPRLAHPEDAADFVMKVERESDDARV
jgi:hypothetical protein